MAAAPTETSLLATTDGPLLAPDHHVGHDATCDGCNKPIFGIRHQCRICPDWNYCDICIAQAPRKHAQHRFAAIRDPQKARDTAAVRSKPLDFGRLETRFLSIGPSPISSGSPNETSTTVKCELSIKSLYESPEYIALSYSWGDQGDTRPILLDGHVTQVTASLEGALKELVAREVKVVWVDALCIDQENDYEKVYQLRQMETIFSKASKVIAWLGPAADESDNAMRALASMHEVDDVDLHGAAIVRLLERRYWERVWIIQELAKATSVEIWCGTHMLAWDTFIKGFETWWSASKLPVDGLDHAILSLKYFCEAETESRRGAARMLLSTAMVRTLHTKASLQRDRVYALIGMTRDGTEAVPTPNYVQSNAEVLKTILIHMMVEQGHLDLMFLAGLERKKSVSPSWLPTWDNGMPLQASPCVVRCFDHLCDRERKVYFQEDVLDVQGKILGNFETEPATPAPWRPISARGTLLQIAIQIFKSSYDALFYRMVDRHVVEEDCIDALAAIWHSPSGGLATRYPDLRQWFEENADTICKGTTLRSIVQDITPNKVRSTLHGLHQSFGPFKNPLWLQRLEVSAGMLLRLGIKLQAFGKHQLVLVPMSTQASDFVAQIANCTLPVVLRKIGVDSYSVVGEVVEDSGWERGDVTWDRHEKRTVSTIEPVVNIYNPRPRHLHEEEDYYLWTGLKDIDWRTLHLT